MFLFVFLKIFSTFNLGSEWVDYVTVEYNPSEYSGTEILNAAKEMMSGAIMISNMNQKLNMWSEGDHTFH